MQAAAWGLLALDNYVPASAVSAALRARLQLWRGELRRAIPPADAKVLCRLFLEFLEGLVKDRPTLTLTLNLTLNPSPSPNPNPNPNPNQVKDRLSGEEKACVDAALEKLRGGATAHPAGLGAGACLASSAPSGPGV